MTETSETTAVAEYNPIAAGLLSCVSDTRMSRGI